MQIGMIGLGRMGANMVQRLLKRGHECVNYDRNPDQVGVLASAGAIGADSLEDFVAKLAVPKTAWLMLPAGEPTENTVSQLSKLLLPGSAFVDGGNTFYKDDLRRRQ